jgi:hypothetical protein
LFLLLSCLVSLTTPTNTSGQAAGTDGENIDLIYLNPTTNSGGGANPPNTPLWGSGNIRVDSVWLGAVFLRDTTKPFKVWFKIRDAGWVGSLYLVVPKGADGIRDTSIFLFKNDTIPNTVVDLMNNPVVNAYVHHLDTVYFQYQVHIDNDPKKSFYIGYSGQNRAPDEGWSRQDRFYATEKSDRTRLSPLGNTFTIGRRYCSAGWMRNISADTRTDTVQFAFEDNHLTGDNDFNDIMFTVTGIDLKLPPNEIKLTVQPDSIICAGDTATITGVVLDKLNRPMPNESNSILWLQDPPVLPGDWVRQTAGNTTKFTATRVYDNAGNPRRIVVRGYLLGSAASYGNISITMKACEKHHLVIESDADWKTSPFADRPIGGAARTLTLQLTTVKDTGYAIFRDRFQNFVAYSTATDWSLSNAAVLSLVSGNKSIGEGIFSRVGPAGTSVVRATEQGLKDSVTVSTSGYTELRVVRHNSNSEVVDSITMRSDQVDTLQVQGYLPATGTWYSINANWRYIAPMGSMTALDRHEILFAPGDTARNGLLVVSLSGAASDTVKVWVKPGLPARLILYENSNPPGVNNPALVNPPKTDTAAAGTAFRMNAKIFDNRNVWLSDYDQTTQGQKIVWSAANTKRDSLNSGFTSRSGSLQDFTPTKAHDIVLVVARLKYDATHDCLDTVLLYIVPGAVSEVRLEYPSGAVIPDSVYLNSPDGILIAHARLYDRYGNRIDSAPDLTSDWTVTPGLHRIPDSMNQTSIYYRTNDVTKEEEGYIKATHNGISDSVKVTIRGPAIQLTDAKTQDSDGNGLLDHMVLTFSRPVNLTEKFLRDSITVSVKVYPNINYKFKIDDVVTSTGQASSVWVIELHDTLINNLPQTNWLPTVTIPAQSTLNLAGSSIISTDGAGPVVWSVTKKLGAIESTNKDQVTVVYSEPITKSLTNPLTITDDPATIFTVWTKDPNDPAKFIEVPTMLKNSQGQGVTIREIGDDKIVFIMSNGEDLLSTNYFTFDTANGGFVFDKAKAVPVADNNQHVKVIVVGPLPGILVVGPNPMRPTVKRKPNGVLDVVNEPNAPQWVKQDQSGVSLSLKFKAPTYDDAHSKGVKVRCAIKIYDLAGNLVQSAKNEDFAPNETGSIMKAFLYWNGTNGKGMAAAPGVYRAVVFIQYWDNGSGASRAYTDMKFNAKVGVGR